MNFRSLLFACVSLGIILFATAMAYECQECETNIDNYGAGAAVGPVDVGCATFSDYTCTQPGYNDETGCVGGRYTDLTDTDDRFHWSCTSDRLTIACESKKRETRDCGDTTSSGGKGPGGQYELLDAGGDSGTDFVEIAQENMCNHAVSDVPLDQCVLPNRVPGFMKFHENLSCLGIIREQSSCQDANCVESAPRRELIGIAARLRGIPLEADYQCRNLYQDLGDEPEWSCQVIEKSRDFGLISSTRTHARPARVMTRAEAFSILMKSICVEVETVNVDTYPEVTTLDWQQRVIWQAMRHGFTIRDENTFEENRPMLMQELYTVASRVTQWARLNGGCERIDTAMCTSK